MNFTSSLKTVLPDLRANVRRARAFNLAERSILRGYVETAEKYLKAIDAGGAGAPDKKELERISNRLAQAIPNKLPA